MLDTKQRTHRRNDLQLWPYGAYLARDGSVVLHDRRYRPIVRCNGSGSVVLTVPAQDSHRRQCTFALHLDNVEPASPDTRIEHDSQIWFYSDGNPPARDRATRERLLKLIAAIPALAAEINAPGARQDPTVRWRRWQ